MNPSHVHVGIDTTPAILRNLCGSENQILHRIEARFDVQLTGHPGDWYIEGEQAFDAAKVLHSLLAWAKKGALSDVRVEGILRDEAQDEHLRNSDTQADTIQAGQCLVRGKTPNQRRYMESIQQHVLTLAVGPAGTGKTYLAVAAAVVALQSHQVERVILTRPAVEAGERLGFLPGDMQQKVDPYLRPLFDALAEMIGMEKMVDMIDVGRIEIAPLAYMRGRTLNDAFIILDEAQNTTREQMKMFLTRLGFSSRMVVTGDVTQVDLANKDHSGLLHALTVLKDIEDIGVCHLTGQDIIRHPLVEQIVSAYHKTHSQK